MVISVEMALQTIAGDIWELDDYEVDLAGGVQSTHCMSQHYHWHYWGLRCWWWRWQWMTGVREERAVH